MNLFFIVSFHSFSLYLPFQRGFGGYRLEDQIEYIFIRVIPILTLAFALSYFTKIGIPKMGQMVTMAIVSTINKTMLAGIPAPKNSPVVNCLDS